MNDESLQVPWFNLNHYAQVFEWNEVDWFRAIACRKAINHLIERDTTEHGSMNETVHAHFEAIAADPIATCGLLWAEPGRSNALFLGKADPDVRMLLMSPALVEADEGTADYYRKHWGHKLRLLAIDLAAPDRVLLSAFSAWLRATRRDCNAVSAITEADLQNWATSRVLPWIDLLLYKRAAKLSITQARIADALFPDANVDRVERLRKVTMKHERRLMSDDFYRQFAAQVGEMVIAKRNET